MKEGPTFEEALSQIVSSDSRYSEDAYYFLREALDFTIRLYEKDKKDAPQKHVSGKELLEGIRKYALQEFGAMAKRVLNSWGLTCTEDFGEIVFNLVSRQVLGKSEDDRKEDFAGGYDFETAFVQPFLPAPEPAKAKTTSKR